MLSLSFAYKDTDGNHWPDAVLGDELYYSIEFANYLSSENDTLVSVAWVLDDNLTSTDAFNSGSEAYIKLKPSKRGTFKAVCNISLTETGVDGVDRTQTKSVEMMLKVV